MAPIYDSNLKDFRYEYPNEYPTWEEVELWEKVQERRKRKKRRWILIAVLVFFLISVLQVTLESRSKWHTLALARVFSNQIEYWKWQVAKEKTARWIRVIDREKLVFKIDIKHHCLDQKILRTEIWSPWKVALKTDRLLALEGTKYVSEAMGHASFASSFCLDPKKATLFPQGALAAVFLFADKKDFFLKREDRYSLVVVKGLTPEVSFY